MKKNSRHKRAWRAALGSSTWAWRTSWGSSSRTGGACSGAVARAGSAGCLPCRGRPWVPNFQEVFAYSADPGEGGQGDHLRDRRPQCLNGGDHYRRDRWQRVRSLKGSEEEKGKIRRKRKKMKYCVTQATIVTRPLLCLGKIHLRKWLILTQNL